MTAMTASSLVMPDLDPRQHVELRAKPFQDVVLAGVGVAMANPGLHQLAGAIEQAWALEQPLPGAMALARATSSLKSSRSSIRESMACMIAIGG
jgi:hypothetical protein